MFVRLPPAPPHKKANQLIWLAFYLLAKLCNDQHWSLFNMVIHGLATNQSPLIGHYKTKSVYAFSVTIAMLHGALRHTHKHFMALSTLLAAWVAQHVGAAYLNPAAQHLKTT